MKVKELKKYLDRLDPSGDAEVCFGNLDISGIFLSHNADNWMHKIVCKRDNDGSITEYTRLEYLGTGRKIGLCFASIPSVLKEQPYLDVVAVGDDPSGTKAYIIEAWKNAKENKGIFKKAPTLEDLGVDLGRANDIQVSFPNLDNLPNQVAVNLGYFLNNS